MIARLRLTRGRVVLLVIGFVALVMILLPAIIFKVVEPTLCPTRMVSEGRVPGGVNWEITRAACDDNRVVWQVRVAPPQGVLRLAYDAENGPEPEGIEQFGRLLTVRLKTPLRNGDASVQVELDHRARPKEAVRIRNQTQLPHLEERPGRS
jgi:hypothetical protein